jgi:hypothetical protein
VVVAWWLASAGALFLVWRNPAGQSRNLSFFLGLLWFWNAVAYHALLFTRINPAAWLFSALFVVQAALFFRAWARKDVEYFSSSGPMRAIGIGLMSYSLAYSFLAVALGHSYPATPTFGVPCPTAILTVGALVTARARVPVTLAIIPVLWAFVGGSAAVLLTVPTDYVLLGAGVLLAFILIEQRIRTSPSLR